MYILSYLCSILFSYLYQLSSINKLSFSYFKLRSKCDNCHQPLKWFELLPIISFICLKGRSNCCGNKLNTNYFIGELLAFLIIPFSTYIHASIYFPLFLITFLFLLTMALYDIDTMTVNINLIVILTILSLFVAHIYVFTFLIFSILLHVCFFIMPNQIGYGDIFLLSLLSLFYSYNFFCIFLLFALLTATPLALFTILVKKSSNIPFIPFIFLGYLLASYFYSYILIYL